MKASLCFKTNSLSLAFNTSSILIDLGFIGSKFDTSLFIYKHGPTPKYILICGDEILITGMDSTLIGELIKNLQHTLGHKDLITLHYFLGVKAYYTKYGLF